MPERRATLKDVARASGVSTTTVSFVLNETPGQTLPPATKERVRAAAAALGYQPHGLARALREGRSRVVLLAIGRLRGGRSLEGFIEGMSGELQAHGYGLLVYPGASSETGHADLVRDLRPHAVIDLAEVYSAPSDTDDGGWVDGLAAHTLTQLGHLAERGHRSIAFATPAEIDLDGLVSLRTRLASEAGRRLGLDELTSIAVPDAAEDARDAVAALRCAANTPPRQRSPPSTTKWRFACWPASPISRCPHRAISRSSASTTAASARRGGRPCRRCGSTAACSVAAGHAPCSDSPKRTRSVRLRRSSCARRPDFRVAVHVESFSL